jgi:hypothetical protein
MILAALQEVVHHAEWRCIDWKVLMGKSATGITSTREYQMMWHHFAYQHELAMNVDANSLPWFGLLSKFKICLSLSNGLLGSEDSCGRDR